MFCCVRRKEKENKKKERRIAERALGKQNRDIKDWYNKQTKKKKTKRTQHKSKTHTHTQTSEY